MQALYVNIFVDTIAFEFCYYVLFRMSAEENTVNIIHLNMLKQQRELCNESFKKT